VTSGNQEKIDKAVRLGAKGGVIYKEKDWDKKLQAMLPKERKYLDAIVDGAGGDVVKVGSKILKVRSSLPLSISCNNKLIYRYRPAASFPYTA